jgi:hypothetical protein
MFHSLVLSAVDGQPSNACRGMSRTATSFSKEEEDFDVTRSIVLTLLLLDDDDDRLWGKTAMNVGGRTQTGGTAVRHAQKTLFSMAAMAFFS